MNNIYINIANLFYKHGIYNVCISPGLRNTALSLSFIKHGKFNCYSIIDERSSAYFALGIALKTEKPSVLICTSGTAVANYFPAIIESNFIRRNRYRGGKPKSKESLDKLQRQFFENIEDSDYTICVRGTGNFSARLYETFAMGRIPIFINTDCILPFENVINWRNHVVWIEYDEVEQISDKIIKFHRSLSSMSFTKLQQDNRSLWEEYFKFSGFYNQKY